jgi:hypothetical protein
LSILKRKNKNDNKKRRRKMTQELDKNGRPKLYCANCGKRMNYTYTQQWFGCSGYKHWGYWKLRENNRVFNTRAEAEVELQRLNALGYVDHHYSGVGNSDLKIDTYGYDREGVKYYVEYSEPVGEQVPWQFHSQECMMEFLQRPDIIRQILPIIEANRAEPIIPVKKPRKKRQVKNDLPDYNAMAKRLARVL